MARSPTPARAAEWRPIFIEALRNSANVRAACKAAGISRQTAYTHKRRATAFSTAWEEAMEDAVDLLHAIAMDRARKQSDTLLIFLLKAHRPALYRETVCTQHTGPNDEPVRFTLAIGGTATPDPDSDDTDA